MSFRWRIFNGDPENILLFQRNYHMIIVGLVNIMTGGGVYYLHVLPCGEALCEFEIIFGELVILPTRT